MARYGPRPWRHYRRVTRQRRSSAGQGGMRAEFSGNQQLIRHTIPSTVPLAGAGEGYQLADGKAFAMPLVIYTGKSNNSTAVPDRSAEPTVAEGSRVNHVQTQIQITQQDATKPNNCYIGTISTSFSDAMLNSENMEKNFANLIGLEVDGTTSAINADTGEFKNDKYIASMTPRDLSIGSYLENPQQRHWIRNLARNQYTLYSGRPIIINQVLPVPARNRRAQFGSGFWLVFMNDSGGIQGESPGDASSINIQANTFFKEIPLQSAPVTT